MTAPIPGVGPQLARAAAGTDPGGVLVFELLPSDLQNAEDSTAAADRQRMTALFDYVELKLRGGNMWVASTPPTGRSAYEPDTVEARDGAVGAGRLRFGWLGWRRSCGMPPLPSVPCCSTWVTNCRPCSTPSFRLRRPACVIAPGRNSSHRPRRSKTHV